MAFEQFDDVRPDGLHVASPEAHVHQRDATFRVDDERGGHAGQIIGGRGRALRVAQNVVVHGIALQELHGIVGSFIHVDCDDCETAAAQFLLQRDDLRYRYSAGRTPGCLEVDVSDLAVGPRQGHR